MLGVRVFFLSQFFFFVALIWQDGKEERLAFLEQCRLSYNVSYCVFQMHPVLRPERAPFYRALCLTGSGAVWALWAKRYRRAVWTERANVQHSQNRGSHRRENCCNPQRFICSHESQHWEKQTEGLCRDRARERKFFSLRITTVKGFTCILDIFKHWTFCSILIM